MIASYMRFARMLTSSLPVTNLKVLALFDLAFNLVSSLLSSTKYYTGAYCVFELSAGSLINQSPLLAKNGVKYSFPGYPISIKWLDLKIRNTTKQSELSGRWAAVFIPYREEHDGKHYAEIVNKLTYFEVATMPHSVSGQGLSTLRIHFEMRDPTMYCSRPRELSEAIGLVTVVWDTSSTDTLRSMPVNSMFCCEIDVNGGCQSHPIFGPSHRVDYDEKVFKIRSLTNGEVERVHHPDGSVRFEQAGHLSDYEMVH